MQVISKYTVLYWFEFPVVFLCVCLPCTQHGSLLSASSPGSILWQDEWDRGMLLNLIVSFRVLDQTCTPGVPVPKTTEHPGRSFLLLLSQNNCPVAVLFNHGSIGFPAPWRLKTLQVEKELIRMAVLLQSLLRDFALMKVRPIGSWLRRTRANVAGRCWYHFLLCMRLLFRNKIFEDNKYLGMLEIRPFKSCICVRWT